MSSQYVINTNTPTPVTYDSPLSNGYETPVKEYKQLVQVSTNYNVSPRSLNTFLRGTGTAIASGSLVLSSGATAQSLSAAESQQYVYSASGACHVCKFSATFNAGVAGVTQLLGYGNNGEGFFFGYNGTSFGVLVRSGGLPQVVSLTVTAGSGALSGTLTITLNSVAFNITVPANSSVYGVVALIMGTSFATAGAGSGWSSNQLGNTVTLTAMTSAVRSGTYSVTKTLTTAAVTLATTLTGVAPTDTWTAQSAWNFDTADATQQLPPLNPAVGNIYQISVETLNYGLVYFYIVEPVSGRYLPVHSVQLRTVPNMAQESCPLRASIENNAVTTPISMSIPDMTATVYGSTDYLQFPSFNTYTNINPTINANVIMHVMSLKNNITYLGALNKSTVRLTSVTLSANSSYCIFFPLVKNSAYSGVPAAGFTWSQTDPDSVTSTTKVNTFNLTGGQSLLGLSLGGTDQVTVDLTPYFIHLEPGDELNVGCGSTQPGAAASSVVYVSVSWVETR